MDGVPSVLLGSVHFITAFNWINFSMLVSILVLVPIGSILTATDVSSTAASVVVTGNPVNGGTMVAAEPRSPPAA